MASKKSSSSSSKKSSYNGSSSGAVPASSSIADLFSPKPSASSHPHSSSSSSSSSSIFGSVFGPSSMGRGRDSTNANITRQYATSGQESHWESGMNSYYQQQTVDQPCNFSNSIYYGGQEVYSPTTRSNEYHVFKKDEQDDDPNSASRGNWWQGSLYY
ncbi:uncharacterized serine-rich protein C215.13-like [Amaranthus tricolor]|uniref:uncharacterized serine-rich protein C215.13-like n=1 Tax=Amaranthus tricolor TaxID=29722 RepID=UPI0025867636|nr:uncharacterized serine-rich protein C215.13-like [Amaranthus tricolor]